MVANERVLAATAAGAALSSPAPVSAPRIPSHGPGTRRSARLPHATPLTKESVSDILREYLADKGHSLGALAQRCRLSKSAVQRLTEGRAEPSLSTFARLVSGLDLTDSERLRLLALAGE